MKVSELLDRPERWCQGESARRDDGSPTGIMLEDAASWCLIGAVNKCIDNHQERIESYDKLQLALLMKFQRMGPLAIWNDDPTRTFDDIKALLEAADL